MPVATENYLTLSEVADQLRVSRRTIRRLIARGELLGLRVGGQIRIPAESLQALLSFGHITPERQTEQEDR